jgi:hypothetical protein
MTWSVTINETALSDVNAYVVGIPAWRDGLGRDYPTLNLPGRQGVVFASDPTVAPRQLRIECTITTTSQVTRQSSEQQLKALVSRGLVSVTVDDDLNTPMVIDAVNTQCSITPRGHPITAFVSDVLLSFLCPDPTWRDVLGQTIGFNTTPVAIPLGTAPSGGIVRIAAPSWSADVTAPVVYYLNVAKATVQSMTFGGTTLVAGQDFLEIDLDRASIVLSDNAVRSSGAALLTAGDFFVLDPMDGDPLNAGYPYLMLGSSAGTPSGQWVGVRRYL